MIKTRRGFNRGMASSHTPPTKRRSTRSFASKQGQQGSIDPDVLLAAKPLNVVVPLKFKLSSKNSSSSEEILDFVQSPKEAVTKEIEIEEEFTPTEISAPVQKTYTSESSKIKTHHTQEEMASMLAARGEQFSVKTDLTELTEANWSIRFG